MANSKTYSQKPIEVTRKWVLIDASKHSLGQIATATAKYLIGKHKPTYTPHIDGGDYVVVINAKDVVVTGDKENSKMYYSYSGFPGGLTELNLAEMRARKPEKIVELAVKGMLPVNKLTAERMKRLRVFAGSDHTHTAQMPVEVEVK